MRGVKERELIRFLEINGYSCVGKPGGSHQKYTNGKNTVSIVSGHGIVSDIVLGKILRDTGLKQFRTGNDHDFLKTRFI